MKEILDGKYNELFLSIVQDIVIGCKKIWENLLYLSINKVYEKQYWFYYYWI
jgi:hypothetical protein